MWKFSSNGVSPQMNRIMEPSSSAPSRNVTVRAWVLSANYWDVFFGMNARFYEELPKHGGLR